MLFIDRAFFLARPSTGRSRLARMPMMAMTTSNSIRVNPLRFLEIFMTKIRDLRAPLPEHNPKRSVRKVRRGFCRDRYSFLRFDSPASRAYNAPDQTDSNPNILNYGYRSRLQSP